MSVRERYNQVQAQADQEQCLIPWAQKHGGDPTSPIIFMPPDPNKPWQAADVFVTPARELPNFPDLAIKLGLWFKLAKGLGAGAISISKLIDSARFARGFAATPAKAEEPNGPTVAERILKHVAAGENTAVVCAHQFLEDVALTAAGLTLATGEIDLIENNNYIVLSPTMKYEGIGDKDLAELIRPTGSLVWTIPYTPNSFEHDIPRQLRAWYGRGVKEELGPKMEDPSQGLVLYVALTGGRMQAEKDAHGNIIGWDFPPIYSQAAAALNGVEHVLTVGLFRDPETGELRWEIGNFISRDEFRGPSETQTNEILMDETMRDLSTRMKRLAGVPVKYSIVTG